MKNKKFSTKTWYVHMGFNRAPFFLETFDENVSVAKGRLWTGSLWHDWTIEGELHDNLDEPDNLDWCRIRSLNSPQEKREKPMLVDYKGPANHPDLFKHMVGEKITAMFFAEGKIWIMVKSGAAFWCSDSNGAVPAFGKTSSGEVERIIAERRRQIETQLAQLRDMPGVTLP